MYFIHQQDIQLFRASALKWFVQRHEYALVGFCKYPFDVST